MGATASDGHGCEMQKSSGCIDYVNAHGTSTPIGDAHRNGGAEARVWRPREEGPHQFHEVDDRAPPGGAGGLEAGISVPALRDQIVPPTINYENPDPACDLDYVPNHARKVEAEYALSNSFGFGGTNASLLFKRWEGALRPRPGVRRENRRFCQTSTGKRCTSRDH